MAAFSKVSGDAPPGPAFPRAQERSSALDRCCPDRSCRPTSSHFLGSSLELVLLDHVRRPPGASPRPQPRSAERRLSRWPPWPSENLHSLHSRRLLAWALGSSSRPRRSVAIWRAGQAAPAGATPDAPPWPCRAGTGAPTRPERASRRPDGSTERGRTAEVSKASPTAKAKERDPRCCFACFAV